MLCPICKTRNPFYYSSLINRWHSVKCKRCGSLLNRNVNLQFVIVSVAAASGVVGLLELASEQLIPWWFAIVASILWMALWMFADAFTIRPIAARPFATPNTSGRQTLFSRIVLATALVGIAVAVWGVLTVTPSTDPDMRILLSIWNASPFAAVGLAAALMPHYPWRLAGIGILAFVVSLSYLFLIRDVDKHALNVLAFIFVPVWFLLLLPIFSFGGEALHVIIQRVGRRTGA